MSEQDNDILDTTLKTQDEIHEVLLGLFYPWNRLQDLHGSHLESLRAAQYKNTWLWTLPVSRLSLLIWSSYQRMSCSFGGVRKLLIRTGRSVV